MRTVQNVLTLHICPHSNGIDLKLVLGKIALREHTHMHTQGKDGVSLEMLFHMTPLSVNLIELAGQYRLHVAHSQGDINLLHRILFCLNSGSQLGL